jgi:two-component system sensor histidine kinase UhpB
MIASASHRLTAGPLRQVLARTSLKARVNLLVSGLLLLLAAGLAALAIDDARKSVREEIEAASKVTHHLLRFVIERELAPLREGHGERLVELMQGLGRVRAQEIVVTAGDGAVRYRSPASSYKLGHDAPAWFAALLTPRLEVFRQPVGELLLEVRPDPSRAVVDAWDDLVVLFWSIGGLLLVANLLLHRLVGRSLSELDQVVSGMDEMARGRLDARLRDFSLPELERLRQSFNAMAAALEASRAENRQLSHDQALARLVQERLDEERRAIARELHDELGQCVTAIRAIALSIAGRVEDVQPEVHGSALSIASVAGSMYDAVHGIVARLRPAALARLGLAEGLREWLHGWQANHPGREVSYGIGIGDGIGELPASVELAVLRIVQEALNNAVRHGEARHLRVRLDSDGGRLTVVVDDDGRGFAPERHAPGSFGLAGMRERASELGGKLEIASRQGDGTRVLATFPL